MTSTIVEFLAHLKSLDVQVSVESNHHASPRQVHLRCNAPEGTLTPELQQELIDRKGEILQFLDQVRSPSAHPISAIQPAARDTVFPLSFAQQRLWFLYQLTPYNPFYNVPAAIRLTGTLDQAKLERSFHEIVQRHAALRTSFTTIDGQPAQVVDPNVKFTLPVVDLRSVPPQDRERITQQLATTEAQRPFNLTTDSLLRVTLLQFHPHESVLLLTLHHIVADGWSLGVLIRELAELYAALVEGRSPTLPQLPIQYTDFACWQRQWLQTEVLEKQLAYWRKQLQNLSVLELPGDRPRPAVQSYQGSTYPLQFSPTLTQALDSLSQQAGVSLFMLLLAAFQTLLYRYTKQEDIAVGSPIANRHRSELEGLIGFFVNSLVMRSDLSRNPKFSQLLEQVRDVSLEAYAHQDIPFEKLVEELEPERNLSRNPLFQVAFALQNAPMQPLQLPSVTLEPVPIDPGTTRFDLEVHLWEPTHGLQSLWQSQSGLSGFVSYSTDLFDRETIARLVGHFQTLLAGIVANPDAHLVDLPLLTPEEYQQILTWSHSPLSAFKRGAEQPGRASQKLCFHQIFAAQAEQRPNAIALVSEQQSLTYQELNQQADRLAQTLQNMGVQPDELIGLCVDRSPETAIGILGILKAGAAYLPLDPAYPRDRLHFMLTDAQITILLTQSWLVAALPESQAQVLCLDQPLPELNPPKFPFKRGTLSSSPLLKGNKGDQFPPVTPDRLAYVIYTSGSTGTPKGVLITHRGLCNVVEAQHQAFQPSSNSRVLQFSSLSFDASVFEIALAFGCGGTLYIPPKSAQLPGMALVQFLQEQAITHALLTPAVLNVLPPAELPALQTLITGGEVCSSQAIDRWAANRHFFNAYGPTETTIWATLAELHPGDNPLTIGRPVANTQVYLLDAALNPVPIGVSGELYIGGAGLAQGYLNRPQLTAERFIANPVCTTPLLKGGRGDQTLETCSSELKLYKTGDRARYRFDGSLEFLGRVDHQIKIRGFRVELGEIEAALQNHPALQNAVAIASKENSENLQLVAYFSLDQQQIQQAKLEQPLQNQQIQHWQTLYNQTYQSPPPIPHFNITGWNSSYTGQPIPAEQMQEWVSDRVQQILALKPKRVLEIGCGTGLLLFQIAPHCQEYWGTDFSTVSLESIQQQLDRHQLTHVKLLHRTATDFTEIDSATFDLVILNSVVQYFPSADYLMQVLEGAMQTVAPSGVLFLGDVRSLPLLTAFHTWIQSIQADSGLEQIQLRQRVERSIFKESELAIDPAFFTALRDRFPQIQRVQIRLSRGHSQNEMTQFRYNVLLHTQRFFQRSIQWLDWKRDPVTVADIQNHLQETKPEIFGIKNIANSRVQDAVKVTDWLFHQTAPKTIDRLRETLQTSTQTAIDPQAWWDLESVLPYQVEISWSTSTSTGDYDLVLIRQGIAATVDFPFTQQPHVYQPWSYYTNDPLQSQFARQLIPELRQHLRQTLPDYMIPAVFVPLQTLPLTPSGKVNRRILPAPDQSIPASDNTQAPRSLTESTLVNIWQDLLRLKQVGIHNNFFELGGHSLLATQMVSRVRDAFAIEMPLQNVFEAPTIAQLAPVIETLRQTTDSTQAPPLVRLDRAAHRRLRSSLTNSNSHLPPNQLPSTASPPPAIAPLSPPNQPIANSASSPGSWSPLVPLTLGANREKNKPPFFCVHPIFGVVFPYLELAHHLEGDRSFYGLQPLGLDGKQSPLSQIEIMATYYIQAIQTIQPQGPYYLGGWSFGGLVAFEMAQQLTQAGQHVELLAILDTPAPSQQPSAMTNLKFLLGTALWSALPFLQDYGAIVTNRLQFLFRSRSQPSKQNYSRYDWFSRWQWSAIARLMPEESQLRLLDESSIIPLLQIFYANSQAAYRYRPQPYLKRIILFKTQETDDRSEDATLGWNQLASEIQLHPVAGNHLSMMKQPHVQSLAAQLQQYL